LTAGRSRRLVIGAVVLVVAVIAGVVGYAILRPPRGGGAVGPTTSTTAGPTGPATAPLTTDQIQVLRQIATRTWAYLAGPGVDPTTHLPKNNVRVDRPGADGNFTSGTEIGLYLSSIVAARDLGLITPAAALIDAGGLLATLQKLATYRGFILRWYSTSTAEPITGPRGPVLTSGGAVSTVDDSWFGQGLVVAQAAFPQLSSQFGRLLAAMNYSLLFSSQRGVLYNTYTVGQGPSPATYDLAYGGPRIADYMAIGSRTVPGSMWWTLNRTPPGRAQRQVPAGQDVTYTDPQTGRPYTVFEGHYTYGNVPFVPTFGGSLFQALAPNLVVPEETFGPDSLGPNNRNSVLAQIAWARSVGYPVWGMAPATVPANAARYDQYGAPSLATKTGAIPDGAVSPYAAFMALDLVPEASYADIADLMRLYPSLYTSYGFLDSVDPTTGTVAQRYMAVSQAVILMAIDDAVDHGKLQTYFGTSPYGMTLQPYLAAERYTVPASLPAAS
jgi:hypothetical protein